MVLSILDFAIEWDGQSVGSCNRNWDTFSVYDGSDDTAFTLGKYCGSLIPSRIESSARNLYVVFKSDYIFTRKGYEVSVTFEPGKIINCNLRIAHIAPWLRPVCRTHA